MIFIRSFLFLIILFSAVPSFAAERAAPFGFEMNILYASQELLSAFQRISKAEDKKQKKNEASQF
jgi:hypothetical protein